MGDRIVVMNDGRVQQVDTPVRVYDWPANLFVASMIGSPPMNLFDAEVQREDGRVLLRAGQLELQLSAEQARALEAAGYRGGQLTAGIRPEALRVAPAGATAERGLLPAVVEVIEPQGADTILDLRWGDHRLAARVDAQATYCEGDPVSVALQPGRVRFFDPASQRLLA